MRHIVLFFVLATALAASGQLSIQPTTTLTQETRNNTSAADSFQGQANGNAAAGNISKLPIRSLLYDGSTTRIYAHFMPWFGGANHLDIGYRSDDPVQVERQVNDMLSRGIQGAIIDWYGPDFARENNTTLLVRDEAERHPGFEFAVMEDGGALKSCANTAGCDVTNLLIQHLNYAYATYQQSPAYMRLDGRPVVFFFGVESYPIDWSLVRAGVSGNPLFIFRGPTGFTKPESDGAFSWLRTSDSGEDMGLSYLDEFYTAGKTSGKYTFGSVYAGFDDSLAPWRGGAAVRRIKRHCGMTWIRTNERAGLHYSADNQLEAIQIVTWNDYEEGTEIESGIDNCYSISASATGGTLSWELQALDGAAKEDTIDHYRVYVSTNGEDLMLLTRAARGARSADLTQFALDPAVQYRLYVQAYGRPTIKNLMSNGVDYQPVDPPLDCPLPAKGTVVFCTPADGAEVSTSARVVARAAASKPVKNIKLYVDGSTVYSASGDLIDTRIPLSPGPHRLTVEARAAGTTVTGTITVTATEMTGGGSPSANQPPQAVLSVSPSSGTAPLYVTASTSGTLDPDGSITSTSIDFGDGYVASGTTATHTYQTTGTYTVTATVTDDAGASSSATATVTVTAPTSTACEPLVAADPSVNICTPADQSVVSSPVRLQAAGYSSAGVRWMQVWVDGVKVLHVDAAKVDTSLTLAAGTRRIVVTAKDNNNVTSKSTVYVTVK